MRRCRRSTRQSRLTDLRGALSYRRPATRAEAAAGTVDGPLRAGPGAAARKCPGGAHERGADPEARTSRNLPHGRWRAGGRSRMNRVPESVEASTPYWRGINHLALVTNDMDATVRFY